MTLETLRSICLAMPDVTEDIKWGADLVFSIGGRMFCVANTEPPHQISFKCTPDAFGELVERPGLRPAPYLARAMWVQEESLGETLERAELERLLRTAYEVVRAKVPKSRLSKMSPARSKKVTGGRRSRAVPAASRRRRR